MTASSDPDGRRPIVVYGATGYTGRLVSRELARRGATFAISGRDPAKLAALAAELKDGPEVVVAGLDDSPALDRMASSARVVLDCAGPFARLGRPVLDAAIRSGSHFLDIAGEDSWLRHTAERDAEAREAGVALVNGVGFDVVPTDCAAVLASEAAGGKPREVRIAFTMRGARPTQGTSRSALARAHLGSLAWIDGEWRREPIGAKRWRVPFPDPVGTREAVSIPWGDVVTAPRSTGASNVRTFVSLPPSAMRLVRFAGVAATLLRIPPVRKFAEWRVGRLPEGPTTEERARARFAVYAEASGGGGTASAWVTGGDGYDFTADSAVECALRAAAQDFAGRGALTPAMAFGAQPLLDALVKQDACQWGRNPTGRSQA